MTCVLFLVKIIDVSKKKYSVTMRLPIFEITIGPVITDLSICCRHFRGAVTRKVCLFLAMTSCSIAIPGGLACGPQASQVEQHSIKTNDDVPAKKLQGEASRDASISSISKAMSQFGIESPVSSNGQFSEQESFLMRELVHRISYLRNLAGVNDLSICDFDVTQNRVVVTGFDSIANEDLASQLRKAFVGLPIVIDEPEPQADTAPIPPDKLLPEFKRGSRVRYDAVIASVLNTLQHDCELGIDSRSKGKTKEGADLFASHWRRIEPKNELFRGYLIMIRVEFEVQISQCSLNGTPEKYLNIFQRLNTVDFLWLSIRTRIKARHFSAKKMQEFTYGWATHYFSAKGKDFEGNLFNEQVCLDKVVTRLSGKLRQCETTSMPSQ
jgi:hypothetical protein